jgi:ABC-type transport system substrate-binding protein
MKRCLFIIFAIILASSMLLYACGEQEEEPAPAPEKPAPAPEKPAPAPEKPAPAPEKPAPAPEKPAPAPEKPAPEPPKPGPVEPEPGPDPLAKPEGGKYGGWLVIPTTSDFSNIGSTTEISNPTDAGYSFLCTEGLLWIDEDGNNLPMLAESWDIGPDGAYLEFKLRKGINFTDGAPFNAEAVKTNIDIQLENQVWTNLKPLDSCEVIDDYTVRMYFDDGRYDWGVVNSLSTFFSCRMFSPDFLLNTTNEYKRSHVVGTGPFILDEYSRGRHIKYVANEDYWRGRPYLDGIELRIIPQAETQLLAFKAGELHFVGIQAKDAADMIEDGYEVTTSYDFVFNGGIMPSASNPESPWADLRVRQAAAHAVDNDLLIEGLTYGYGMPSNQVFIESQPWYNPDTVGYEYDPEKSLALLGEAGLGDGFSTDWHLLDFMSLDTPIAVQDMLRAVGIDASFKLVSMPIYNSMVATGWEGIVWGGVFAGSAMEPSGQMVNGVLNGKTTWVGAIQPDELYEKALEANSEFDFDTRKDLYQYIAKSLTDDYCQVAYLPYMPGISSISPEVQNALFGTTLYSYTYAWLD